MQLQFNNSPLGGRGGIKSWKVETRFSAFFFSVVVFGVLCSPLLRWERRLEKERGLVFHVLLPGTHSSCSRMLLRLLLIGCHWQNGLCHRLYSPLRLQAVFTRASYLRSGGTNATVDNNNNNSMRGWQAAVILTRYCQACWTEIMVSHPACWPHPEPHKIARVVTHDYSSWALWTVTIMTHSMRTNEELICHIMWFLATASRVHSVSLLWILL